LTWNGSTPVNDSISLTFSGGSYNNRNAGTGKGVTLTGASLSGSGAGNYTVAGLSGGNYAGSVGVINQAPLTVVAQANTKAFDGTTSAAAVPIVSGLQGTDTAVATETYSSPAVGTGKTLTSTATVNDGNGGANYLVSLVANTNGEITGTSPTPTPNPAPTPSPGTASDLTVPQFVPTVANVLGTTKGTRAAGATTPARSLASLLTVSGEVVAVTERDALRVLAAPSSSGRLSTPAVGAAFLKTYSDGTSGPTNVITVDEQSIRFTVPDKAFALGMEVPVAVGNDILGRFSFQVSAGQATVSASRSVGILGGRSAVSPDASRIDVRMSRDAGEIPLEFTVAFSGGVVSITPKGATAQALFEQKRDEALFRLIIGQAIFDAATKLKAVKITAVRVIRPA
jgi:hypothetical protein